MASLNALTEQLLESQQDTVEYLDLSVELQQQMFSVLENIFSKLDDIFQSVTEFFVDQKELQTAQLENQREAQRAAAAAVARGDVGPSEQTGDTGFGLGGLGALGSIAGFFGLSKAVDIIVKGSKKFLRFAGIVGLIALAYDSVLSFFEGFEAEGKRLEALGLDERTIKIESIRAGLENFTRTFYEDIATLVIAPLSDFVALHMGFNEQERQTLRDDIINFKDRLARATGDLYDDILRLFGIETEMSAARQYQEQQVALGQELQQAERAASEAGLTPEIVEQTRAQIQGIEQQQEQLYQQYQAGDISTYEYGRQGQQLITERQQLETRIEPVQRIERLRTEQRSLIERERLSTAGYAALQERGGAPVPGVTGTEIEDNDPNLVSAVEKGAFIPEGKILTFGDLDPNGVGTGAASTIDPYKLQTLTKPELKAVLDFNEKNKLMFAGNYTPMEESDQRAVEYLYQTFDQRSSINNQQTNNGADAVTPQAIAPAGADPVTPQAIAPAGAAPSAVQSLTAISTSTNQGTVLPTTVEPSQDRVLSGTLNQASREMLAQSNVTVVNAPSDNRSTNNTTIVNNRQSGGPNGSIGARSGDASFNRYGTEMLA